MTLSHTEVVTTDKPITLADVPQREVFDSFASAGAYIQKLSTLATLEKVAMSIYGYEVKDGAFVETTPWPSIDDESMGCMVVRLTKQEEFKEGDATVKRGVNKAVLVQPVPTLTQLLANDLGKAMVQSVMDKELNHRMVRPVRTADDIQAVLGEMPATLEAYCATTREAGTGGLATFNEYWKSVHDYVADKLERVSIARLRKNDLKKAFENAAWAEHYFPMLEEKGDFVLILSGMITLAQGAEFDTTVLESWLANRDEQTFTGGSDGEGEEALDLGGLMEGLTKPKATATPAT